MFVHVRAKTHALFAAIALVAGLAAAAPPALAEEADGDIGLAQDCTPDHVWFLGIVYDAEQRQDFKADVRNFEIFLSTLRQTYCIPESQATILAMENNYTDQGKTYAEGSEANLKAELRRMGAEASQHEDSKFFFFLSSHGSMWSSPLGSECPRTRAAMSYANLKDGGGEDGFLDDCELGDELNDSFRPDTRMFVAVDCSFCGGFSDSLTAVSGTVPDGSIPESSGIPAPNRVVITGCAITTECFGSTGNNGGVTYHHMRRVLQGNVECDGWTAPGFPEIQGFDAPVNGEPFNAPDDRCTASEWFFGAVQSAYTSLDIIGIQQQFRIKYGMDSLDDDIVIVGEDATGPDPSPSPSPSPTPTESPSPSPTPTESPSPSPEPEFSIAITSPAEGEVVDPDFVAEGTTEGAAGGEALRLLPRSNVDRPRDVAGAGAAVDELRAERLPVLEFDEVVELDQPPPRAVPEDSIGIGPGSTILINRGGSTGLCTAAFIFRDKSTGKVYLGTAGHCFMPDNAESTDGQGANFNKALVTRVRVCVANCIGGLSGLGSAALGIYPGNTRDLGPPTGPKLAYARQKIGTQELGNDFGIVEIPPNLWNEIRTDMPVWGGPDTSDTSRRIQLGDPIAHYGNGAVVGETFPTKGRAGVGGIGTTASFWTMYGAAAPGDSGSAVNIGTVGGASGLEGRWPAGNLTHLICCGGNVGGTNASRAIQMAQQDAGFDLELIHDPSQLGPPPDPGTDPGDTLEAAITFPDDGATLDASETPVVEVQGTGSFPLKGGPGTETLRYFTHRNGCGGTGPQPNVLWMDLNRGAAPDSGDGCGSFAGPIGPVWEPVVGEITSTHPADPRPQEPILLDPDRPIRATMVLGGSQGLQDNPQPVPVLLDASVRLTHDGVTVGSQRITNEIILAPHTEVVFEFPAQTSAIPADAPLTFTFVVHHAAGPVFVHHGGDTGSHLDIPLAAEPDNRVEVSVDDPSFSEGSLLTVSGTESWSAPWDIGDLEGEHTLYARAVQNGTVQDPPASVTVDIVSAEPPSEFAVEVRLTGDSGTIVDWTPADDFDGTDWSHPFTDVPSGDVTLDARLLRDSEVVATDSVSFTVARAGPAATQIFFTEDSATEGRYTENVLIEARLIDSDGNPVAGREVEFRLTGVDDETSWSVTTDGDGIAGETVTLESKPGGYLLRAAFAGDEDFDGSETSTFFVIERMDTDTELVVQGTGAKRTLTATLTTEPGKPIQGATIDFFGDGQHLGSAVTNAQGRAVLQAPPGYRGNRRHHFEAVFEGDDFYKGSSGTDST